MDYFTVSPAPHIRTQESTSRIMLDVVIALIPAGIASIYFNGIGVLWTILISVATAVLTEYLIQKFMKKPITISDFSAVVTGVLMAYNLPPGAPWWLAAIGSFLAIALVKQLFGGLGHNFMNPALAARAILLAAWPVRMTTWVLPDAVTSATSSATPLAMMEGTWASASELPGFLDVFLGNIGGSIGETSSVALLIGAVYLLVRKVISWRIPVTYITTTFILTALLGGHGLYGAFYQVFLGGLILGAFYMATDYSSSPITPKGQIIMGVGCGILTAVIRIYGGYPEGVSYSILLMNVVTPLIDKYTMPKIFGEGKAHV
ncbi:RnfABCDGE type electron transport complex subunit D [Eubacteriales bacterium mix99]|jgi:electron transport complex protein RnfD|nr:Na+-transporting NADH:ubiquinone oxidoreductase subunit D [Clostridiales bacterium]